MKAAFINRTGPAEVITFGELPNPKPAPQQCLIKVAAVDVNPIDVYVRSGMLPARLQFPYILGRDLAGTVIECGSNVSRFKPGDRVWASNQGADGRPGTFAELAAVDEMWLNPLPPNVKEEDATAISLVGSTAYLGLVAVAGLKSGETLFVNGGSGGVGSCVVQIGKILGARVITTAGSDEKVKNCREMGADVAVNYKKQDVDAVVKEFAPTGINVWWETVAEPNFERSIPLLSVRGRMIVMAGRNARAIFPVGPFYTRNCSVLGFAIFNFDADEHRRAANALNQWLSEGRIKAKIDRILPLSEAALAHRLQEESTVGKAGTLTGKIVLKP